MCNIFMREHAGDNKFYMYKCCCDILLKPLAVFCPELHHFPYIIMMTVINHIGLVHRLYSIYAH